MDFLRKCPLIPTKHIINAIHANFRISSMNKISDEASYESIVLRQNSTFLWKKLIIE